MTLCAHMTLCDRALVPQQPSVNQNNVIEDSSKDVPGLWRGSRYSKRHSSEAVFTKGMLEDMRNPFCICTRNCSVAAPSPQHDLVVPLEAAHTKHIENLLVHATEI